MITLTDTAEALRAEGLAVDIVSMERALTRMRARSRA